MNKDYEALKRFVETGWFPNRRPFVAEDFVNFPALIGRKVVPFDLDKRDTRHQFHLTPSMMLLEGVELVIGGTTNVIGYELPSGTRAIWTRNGTLHNKITAWWWHPDWLLLVDE